MIFFKYFSMTLFALNPKFFFLSNSFQTDFIIQTHTQTNMQTQKDVVRSRKCKIHIAHSSCCACYESCEQVKFILS